MFSYSDSEDENSICKRSTSNDLNLGYNYKRSFFPRKSHKVCKFNLNGDCRLGRKCFYQHTNNLSNSDKKKKVSSKTQNKFRNSNKNQLDWVNKKLIFKIESKATKKNKKNNSESTLERSRSNHLKIKLKYDSNKKAGIDPHRDSWREGNLLLEKLTTKNSKSGLRKRRFSCDKLSYLDRIRLIISDDIFKEDNGWKNNLFKNDSLIWKLSIVKKNRNITVEKGKLDLTISNSYTSSERIENESSNLSSEVSFESSSFDYLFFK